MEGLCQSNKNINELPHIRKDKVILSFFVESMRIYKENHKRYRAKLTDVIK